MTEGFYYFNIKTGYNNTITIFRNTREEAEYAYTNYVKQRKECEWLGKWEGNKFVDSDINNAA